MAFGPTASTVIGVITPGIEVGWWLSIIVGIREVSEATPDKHIYIRKIVRNGIGFTLW